LIRIFPKEIDDHLLPPRLLLLLLRERPLELERELEREDERELLVRRLRSRTLARFLD
jgi:hypothetical protein